MYARASPRGYVLLLVLLVLAVAGVALAATCRATLRRSAAATAAGADVQQRWGSVSAQYTVLSDAENVLERAEVAEGPGGPPVATLHAAFDLGTVRFDVDVCDEQARANVNALLAWRGRTAAGGLVRDLARAAGGHRAPRLPAAAAAAGPLHAISATPDAEPDELPTGRVPPVLGSLSDVFPGAAWDELRPPGLAGVLTVHGDGKVNPRRASVAALSAACGPLLSPPQVAALSRAGPAGREHVRRPRQPGRRRGQDRRGDQAAVPAGRRVVHAVGLDPGPVQRPRLADVGRPRRHRRRPPADVHRRLVVDGRRRRRQNRPRPMSIVLIGYRGSGKTTVGRAVAVRLGWPFVDADAVVVDRAGMTIRELFDHHGEPHFRRLESAVVAELAGRRDHVIALGGGAVLAAATRAALAAAGHPVVYLRGTPDELHRRIAADPATADARPSLTALGGGLDEVKSLLAARDAVYRSAMTHAVDVVGRTVDELAAELAAIVRPPV